MSYPQEAYSPTSADALKAKITFESGPDDRVYRPGEHVAGTAKIRVQNEGLVCKGVKVVVCGVARTRFKRFGQVRSHSSLSSGMSFSGASVSSSGGLSRNSRRRTCRMVEPFFRDKTIAFGDGEKDVYLPGGEHSYPFSVVLPEKLPTTFHHVWGKVIYYAGIRVMKDGFAKMGKKKEFYVRNGETDFYWVKDALAPASWKEDTQLGGCCSVCCPSGPISYKVSTNKTCYYAGETVEVTARVENESSATLQEIAVSLNQEIVFYGIPRREFLMKHRGDLVEVDRKVMGELNAGEADSFSVSIDLPGDLPSGPLKHCHIIEITYQVSFQISPQGMYSSISIPLDIVIE